MIQSGKLGLAAGLIWGLSLFVTTVISIYTGYAALFLNTIASAYPGMAITWKGSFLALGYGFVDAYIGFLLVGWLYNRFSSK